MVGYVDRRNGDLSRRFSNCTGADSHGPRPAFARCFFFRTHPTSDDGPPSAVQAPAASSDIARWCARRTRRQARRQTRGHGGREIGRADARTPGTNAEHVCRLLATKKKKKKSGTATHDTYSK